MMMEIRREEVVEMKVGIMIRVKYIEDWTS